MAGCGNPFLETQKLFVVQASHWLVGLSLSMGLAGTQLTGGLTPTLRDIPAGHTMLSTCQGLLCMMAVTVPGLESEGSWTGLPPNTGNCPGLLQASGCGLSIMLTGPYLCLSLSQLNLGQLPLDVLGMEVHFAWKALVPSHLPSPVAKGSEWAFLWDPLLNAMDLFFPPSLRGQPVWSHLGQQLTLTAD